MARHKKVKVSKKELRRLLRLFDYRLDPSERISDRDVIFRVASLITEERLQAFHTISQLESYIATKH